MRGLRLWVKRTVRQSIEVTLLPMGDETLKAADSILRRETGEKQ